MQKRFHELWRKAAEVAGIRQGVWCRDLRAAGITEGRQAGALTDDLAKQAGHSNKRTTAEVYDRDRLEAHRRVAQSRVAYRDKDRT
jgi:integrase